MKGFGLVHIYCGSGKGKTTAAIGLSVRCAGRGNKVLIVQFLKSKDTGELESLKLLPNIDLLRGKESKKFTFQMTEAEKAEVRKEHDRMFSKVREMLKTCDYKLVVFDEIIGACNNKVFDEATIIDFLKNKPEGVEFVLTGRGPSKELLDLADYVSEITPVKHPMQKGIAARDGIER